MDEKPFDKQLSKRRAFWTLSVVSIACFAFIFYVGFTHPRGVPVEFFNYPVKTVLLISAGMVGFVAGPFAYAIGFGLWGARRRRD